MKILRLVIPTSLLAAVHLAGAQSAGPLRGTVLHANGSTIGASSMNP